MEKEHTSATVNVNGATYYIVHREDWRMELRENSSRALSGWVRLESWYSGHSLDMKRFYNFVDHYRAEHGNYLDEVALVEEISTRLRPAGHFSEGLESAARAHASLAKQILEFLEATGR